MGKPANDLTLVARFLVSFEKLLDTHTMPHIVCVI